MVHINLVKQANDMMEDKKLNKTQMKELEAKLTEAFVKMNK
jgi:hypothetical protein